MREAKTDLRDFRIGTVSYNALSQRGNIFSGSGPGRACRLPSRAFNRREGLVSFTSYQVSRFSLIPRPKDMTQSTRDSPWPH